jgi:hypothetical protein
LRLGDRSELLVGYLLAAVAFTTPVLRQEDVGIDFTCSLITGPDESLLKPGLFFSVQAKSKAEPVVYEKTHELEWIRSQENPLLLCVADRAASAMDVYSTWNLLCAVQAGWRGQKPSSIRLCPGESSAPWPGVIDQQDGSQDVLLGKPIIRITHDEVFDGERTREIAEVLDAWVAIDRQNIVNRHAGMNWVVGPLAYETGKPPGGPDCGVFYWNPKNFDKCVVNLGRSNAAMWNLLNGLPERAAQEPWSKAIAPLKQLLQWHCREVDQNLRNFVQGLDD